MSLDEWLHLAFRTCALHDCFEPIATSPRIEVTMTQPGYWFGWLPRIRTRHFCTVEHAVQWARKEFSHD